MPHRRATCASFRPVPAKGDATEQKEAAEALRRSEERFRDLVDGLDAIVWEADIATFSFTYVSRRAETIFGYPVERWLELGFWAEHIHPDDREEAVSYCVEATAGGRDHKFEYRMIAADGREIWLSDIVRVITDESGTPNRLTGVLIDITERRLAEAEHELSEQRFRAIFDSASVGIVVVDDAGCLVESNRAFRDMVGYSEAELRSIPFSAYTHPDDLLPNLELFEELRAGKRDSYRMEKRYLRKGVPVWVNLSTSRLSDSSRRGGLLLAVVEDITEKRQAEEALRESEERYRELFENADDAHFTAGVDGRIISVNRAAERMSDYSRGELVGKQFTDLLAPEALEATERAFAAKLQGRSETSVYESAILAKNGRRIAVEVSSRPIIDGDRLVGIQGSVRDISERRKLEQQLHQAQKMEAVGRLAGGIAHDFNNLLTAIGGYSELLLSRLGPGDPLRREAEEIRRAGGRAASLTTQLLAFSRRQMLQPKVVDANAILAETQSMLGRLIGEDVELLTRPARDLWHVRADPGQLQQVIVNLAVNARDAMPEGGRLTIETRNAKVDSRQASRLLPMPAGEYVQLSVSDTGVGMDAETRSHVFEPFFTTKDLGGGTGLGLATVYGIVKQSEGFVFVASEPGQGATFDVYLPRVEEELEGLPAPLEPSPLFGFETVLLVEDEDVVRELVRELLEGHGYTVLEARNGEEAVRLCRGYDRRIDLLLTDVVMPKLGGRELAERVAAERPGMRILFMSGYTDVFNDGSGVLPPGGGFIQKPFSTAVLAQHVRELLDAPPGRMSGRGA